MHKFFISYRREDSGFGAGRIYDYLIRYFGLGSTFQDVNSIRFGSNFHATLDRAIHNSRVFLLIIGPNWLGAKDDDQRRRIDLPLDYVRWEIERALLLRRYIIPVLVDNASMPREEALPPSIKSIHKLHAISIPQDPFFEAGMDKLINHTRPYIKTPPPHRIMIGKGVYLDLMYIPGGTFIMGSPNTKNENEIPQRFVSIRPFYIGKYPVTCAQWWVAGGPTNVEIGQHLYAHPITRVSFLEAYRFCQYLTQKTQALIGQPKRVYRLPTEAEWEYACRAGSDGPFNIDTKSAYPMNCDMGFSGAIRHTSPVGNYATAENSFGLYDMHGNVWEWCEDNWHNSYDVGCFRLPPADGTAWLNRWSPDLRVIRGGSFCSPLGACRSTSRFRQDQNNKFVDVGFRVCLQIDH